jgi:hypothetical protein
MRAKDYRDIHAQQGTPARFPMPKAKVDMTRPVQNLRGSESKVCCRQRATVGPR